MAGQADIKRLEPTHRLVIPGHVDVVFKRQKGAPGRRCLECHELVRQGEEFVMGANGYWFHMICAGFLTTLASHEQSGCPECFCINCDCERDRA